MTEQLLAALHALGGEVAALELALPSPDQVVHHELRDRLVAELDAHAARVRDVEAPLLAVLGGGSGAGKSTVTNSLVGHAVAATGVVRPTTSSPTLLVDPLDRDWFTGDRILPGYARAYGTGPETGREAGRVLHIVESHAIPPGLAVLDAPDVDSVRIENRRLADELLDAADVWVWFVTVRTYADEAGMAYLRRAARRRTALAVVLTQAHERETEPVLEDLRAKLAIEGLDEVRLLVVPHAPVQNARLPERAVSDVRAWLRSLAEPDERQRLRQQTLDGALTDLRAGVEPLLHAVADERETVERLGDAAERTYTRVPDRFAEALDEGPPLRQEVLARWTAFVGTSRFLSFVESATAMVRGWVRDLLATPTSAEQERLQREVRGEVVQTLSDLTVATCDLAAADVAAAWEDEPAGAALLDAAPHLRRSSEGLDEAARTAFESWQEAVTELIRTRGAERAIRARWVSTIVNAAATAAIVLTFASTGGLTGAEVGVAAGASAANQALLVKLLGAQNLSWVLRRAREELLDRVAALSSTELERFRTVLAEVRPSPDSHARLSAALDAVDAVRGSTA